MSATCVKGFDPNYKYVVILEKLGLGNYDRMKVLPKAFVYDLEGGKKFVEKEFDLLGSDHYKKVKSKPKHAYVSVMITLCPIENTVIHSKLMEEAHFWCWIDKCWKKIL